MPINDDELLAAVSGGADSVDTPTPTIVENADDTGTDDGSAETGADDASDDGDSAAGEQADAEGGDGSEAADGTDDGAEAETLGADGKPVAKQAGKAGAKADELDPATGKPFTPEQIAEKKVAKERADFLAEQEKDPINAPIPKYLKEPTQKRMRALVDIAKETTAKLDAATKDRNEIIGMITDTGANAMQYRGALNYLKLVNSGDPQQIQAAINVMQQELQVLSRAAGIQVAGVDHLVEHADLQTEVAAGQLTAARAQEIAVQRNQRKFQQERGQQTERATQQQREQAQLEHHAGVQALNDIGRQLAAKDPNYRAKAVEVLKTVQPQMQQAPPSKWAQMFLVAYTTYQPPAAARVVPKVPVVPKNQPLRGNNPSGGQQSAPKSIEDAINMGIAAGTR